MYSRVALSPCLLSPGSPPGFLSVDMTIRTQTPFSHISFKHEAALLAASYIVGATLAVALVFCGRPGFPWSPWFFAFSLVFRGRPGSSHLLNPTLYLQHLRLH